MIRTGSDKESAPTGWLDRLSSGWFPYLWIALLGFLAYARTLGFGYVFFDDDHLVLKNFELIGSLKNVFLAFRTDMNWQSPGIYYRPLATVTFMLDAVWSGKNPWGYHLTNIILHLAASLLLFRLFLVLGHQKKAALVASLIFTAHPLLVHAVAFIPGRYDSLLAVMILSAMISLAAYLKRPSLPLAAVHFLALLAALFTKETAVAFPAVGFIYFLLSYDLRRQWPKLAVPGISWVAAVGIFLLNRSSVASEIPIKYNTAVENLAGLLSYLGKVFLPYNLSVMPIPQNAPLWPGMITLVFLLILFALGKICRQRYFLFGLGWFLLFLAPTMVRTLDFAYLLEQRMYLPLMGMLMMVLESKALAKAAVFSYVRVGLVALIVALGAASFAHSGVYRNDLSFWQNAATSSPDSYFAHSMLGQRYADRNSWPQAERELLRAKKLNPGSPYVRHDLGIAQYHTGDFPGSLEELQACLRLDTLMADAELFLEMARAQIKLNRPAEAEASLKRSFALDPDNPETNNLLSLTYYLHSEKDLARRHYLRAVELGYPYDPRIIDRIDRLKNKNLP